MQWFTQLSTWNRKHRPRLLFRSRFVSRRVATNPRTRNIFAAATDGELFEFDVDTLTWSSTGSFVPVIATVNIIGAGDDASSLLEKRKETLENFVILWSGLVCSREKSSSFLTRFQIKSIQPTIESYKFVATWLILLLPNSKKCPTSSTE